MFCSVLAVIVYMVKSDRATSAVRKLQDNLYANVSFQEAIARLESENAVSGIITFIVTASLFRLIRFNLVNQHVAEFSKNTEDISATSFLFCCCAIDSLPCFLYLVF